MVPEKIGTEHFSYLCKYTKIAVICASLKHRDVCSPENDISSAHRGEVDNATQCMMGFRIASIFTLCLRNASALIDITQALMLTNVTYPHKLGGITMRLGYPLAKYICFFK